MKSVAIGIPVYNGSSYIEQALNSVFLQGDSSWLQVIVVDDCSTDDTVEVVKRWLFERGFPEHVKFDQLSSNRGVSAARNRILEMADSDYVLFLDGDDVLLPDCLISFQDLLVRNFDVVYSPLKTWAGNNEATSEVFAGVVVDVNSELGGIQFYDYYREHPKTGYHVDASCGIFYRKAFLDIHMLRYTEGMVYLEDGEFLGRVFSVVERSIFQETPFYLYRNNPQSANARYRELWSEVVVRGFLLGLTSLRDFKRGFPAGSAQALMINLVLAKYCLLPYQSVVCWRGVSLRRHQLVHRTMKQAGFYPITVDFSHAFFQRLVRMINRSVWLFYAYYWLRLVKNFLSSKFKR